MVRPPHSSDMNSLEHLWDQVEKHIRTRGPTPINIEAMGGYPDGTDHHLSRDPLMESMSHRIAALRRAKGDPRGSLSYDLGMWVYINHVYPYIVFGKD